MGRPFLQVGFDGQASLGTDAPDLGAAGAASLTSLVSVLLAMNMSDYGRSIIYGVVVLVLLHMDATRERGEAYGRYRLTISIS